MGSKETVARVVKKTYAPCKIYFTPIVSHTSDSHRQQEVILYYYMPIIFLVARY